jgi:phage tail-like protein
MTTPLPGHHFIVEWGGTRLGFTSVSGLDQEVDVVEYREGNMRTSHPVRIPGLHRPGTVVLRRGVVAGDGDFQAWLSTVRNGTVERRDLTVSLLNEEHDPVMSWRLRNAWPSGLRGPALHAMRSEVAIEELVIVHEGIQVVVD